MESFLTMTYRPTAGTAVTSAGHAEQNATQSAATSKSADRKSVGQNRHGWRQFLSAHGREIFSSVIELAGIGVLIGGFWLIRPWCGVIVGGVGFIASGFAMSPRFDGRGQPR